MKGLHSRQITGSERRAHVPLQLPEEAVAIAPLADALQAVHEVGKGLGEMRRELQRARVRVYGVVVLCRIFVRSRHICLQIVFVS
jgi:hypothetical protein